MPRAKKEQADFEQLLQRLEQTVAELEQGRLPLEDLLQKYGEGIKLVQECQSLLHQAEQLLPQEAREESIWN